jgi:hypothetical protein
VVKPLSHLRHLIEHAPQYSKKISLQLETLWLNDSCNLQARDISLLPPLQARRAWRPINPNREPPQQAALQQHRSPLRFRNASIVSNLPRSELQGVPFRCLVGTGSGSGPDAMVWKVGTWVFEIAWSARVPSIASQA